MNKKASSKKTTEKVTVAEKCLVEKSEISQLVFEVLVKLLLNSI